jgi:hypothetical protein
MTTIRTLVMALVLSATALATSAREAPLKDPGRVELASAGAQASAARVRQAIVLAGASRGWTVMSEQPGRLKLHFNKGDKHRVTVEVSYDEAGFEIRYVDSFNLNHAQRDGQTMIHPNYNRWVNNLAHDTRLIYAQGGALAPLPAASSPS